MVDSIDQELDRIFALCHSPDASLEPIARELSKVRGNESAYVLVGWLSATHAWADRLGFQRTVYALLVKPRIEAEFGPERTSKIYARLVPGEG